MIKTITDYITKQAKADSNLSALGDLLGPGKDARIGLILTDRLINIPPQVVPPMYRMLLEEISWAVEEQEPYEFSHYLIFSKTYTEVSSSLDLETDKPRKKKKKQKVAPRPDGDSSIFYFHAEDEVLQQHASISGGFNYTGEGDGQSDSKRAFQDLGVKPRGHLMLIEARRFEAAVKAVEDFIQQT